MALDPLAKTLLDQMAATPGKKPWDSTLEEARADFRAMVRAYGPKDVPIGKIENLTMPGPGGELPLRVYTPVAAGGEALPALVYFHGGSFWVGDFETHEGQCRLLAGEAGCRVIAVDYRLAPEHPFPAALDDCLAATQWIETNAAKLGVDPNRIAVGGDSAGGALAAAVCQTVKAQAAPHILQQMLLFPVVQFGAPFASIQAYGAGYMLEVDALSYCYGRYAPKELWKDPRVSPLVAPDLAGLPPAYIMLAECDPLHDEGLAYAEKLRAAGVKVTVADHPGLVHGFTLFQAMLPQAREALVNAAKHLKAGFDTV